MTSEQEITINTPAPTGITITSADAATIGTDHTLSATVAPQGAIQTVNWTIEPAVTGVTIEEDNKLKSVTTVRHGTTVTVKATSTVASSISKTQMITLNAPAPVSIDIAVDSGSYTAIGYDFNWGGIPNLVKGYLLRANYKIQPNSALQKGTASLENPVNGVTIENVGNNQFILRSTVDAVDSTITVVITAEHSNAEGESVRRKQVIVLQDPRKPTDITLERLLGKDNVVAVVGSNPIDLHDVFQISTTPFGANPKVTWSVSDGTKATVAASTGLLTAISSGTITLTVTSTVDTDKSDTKEFNIIGAITNPVTKVEITTTGPFYYPENRYALEATVMGGSGGGVTWTTNPVLAGSSNFIQGPGILNVFPSSLTYVTIIATSVDPGVDGIPVIDEEKIMLLPTFSTFEITSKGPATIGQDYTLTSNIVKEDPDAPTDYTWSILSSSTGISLDGNILKSDNTVTAGSTVYVYLQTTNLTGTTYVIITFRAP